MNYETGIAKCEEVIVTTLERRGHGTEQSPVRCIVQTYTKDGHLIAEHDPCLKEELEKFADGLIEKDRDRLYQIIRFMR